MPDQPHIIAKMAALLLSSAAALILLVSPSTLSASGASQDISDAPEITEPECSFWLDYDDDGEGDEPFEAEPEEYILQQTPVVGGCTFKLNAPMAVTMLVESELRDWEAIVALKREPDPAEEFRMYPGRGKREGIAGSMRVTANLEGGTPRSTKIRNLTDGYRQEVQIPEQFRLLEISVTTPDGSRDRLELNVQSASGAYLHAYGEISQARPSLPDWVIHLAEEWQGEGYPQIADSIIDRAEANTNGNSSSNWWMWGFIGTWVIILVALLIVSVVIIVTRKKEAETSPDPGSKLF